MTTKKINWDKASDKEIKDELYRQFTTYEKKFLAEQLIEIMTVETRLDWVKQWYEGSE